MRNLIIAGVLVIVVLVVACNSLYVVDETEQVIITRFGEVQDVHRTAGIRAKAPFVDTVVRFDRRLLRIDADPESMRDVRKENLEIDSYARSRVIDAPPRPDAHTHENETTDIHEMSAVPDGASPFFVLLALRGRLGAVESRAARRGHRNGPHARDGLPSGGRVGSFAGH